ncbi:hypothetical protein N9L92_03085 [Saprospiraceae bacterium]|nr:hypothetical protein [Saprospiraceae bacterium]
MSRRIYIIIALLTLSFVIYEIRLINRIGSNASIVLYNGILGPYDTIDIQITLNKEIYLDTVLNRQTLAIGPNKLTAWGYNELEITSKQLGVTEKYKFFGLLYRHVFVDLEVDEFWITTRFLVG